jgi:hypothetical protein
MEPSQMFDFGAYSLESNIDEKYYAVPLSKTLVLLKLSHTPMRTGTRDQ